MTKIPKIIHYCWFGKKEKPRDIADNIKKWKQIMPDYTFIEWNESNFNISENQYAKEAYESNKFAFVSDFVRISVLNEYGGIYLDTDVEVIKAFDNLLKLSAFIGMEDNYYCGTGTIGSVKKHPFTENILSYYDNRPFIKDDGKLDLTTNPKIITNILVEKFNFIPQNQYQLLNYDIHVFPIDYFCAKSLIDGSIIQTHNTYTIHHFDGTWQSNYTKIRFMLTNKIKKILVIFLGEDRTQDLLRKINKL